MFFLKGAAAVGLFLLCGEIAAADATLAPDARAALERTIGKAAETGPMSWRSGSAGGVITPGRAFSKETLRECDACADRCRHIDYTVVLPDSTAGYRGVRCRDESGAWRQTAIDQQISISYPPKQNAVKTAQDTGSAPPVPPITSGISAGSAGKSKGGASVVEIQRDLRALMYYRGSLDGRFTSGTKAALAAFLEDERASLDVKPGPATLNLLRAALRRQTHGTCPKPSRGVGLGKSVVCGVLAD